MLLNERPPAVSIAIRAYRRRWLADSIASVLGQTYRDLELVVYDDAGDLEPVVREFDDPRVRYVRAERRTGASGRFRAAVAACRGRYIGVLDDDDFYEPEFVARLAAALDADPEAGIAFCRIVWDADGVRHPTRNGQPPGRQPDAARALISEAWRVQPSRMLIRRTALEDGERRQPMPEDVSADFFVNVRTAVAGWHHVLVDEVLVVCRTHAGQMTNDARTAHARGLASVAALKLDDPELDRVRRAHYAWLLVRRSLFELTTGDRRAARTGLHEAAATDPAVAPHARRLLMLVTAIPGAGAAARLANRVRLGLRRGSRLPADVAGTGRAGHQVARDAASFAVGAVFAQGLTVLAAPVLTRLYSPAEIGAASVLTAVMAFVWLVACGRYNVAIPLARDERTVRALCTLCGAVTVASSALLLVIWLLFGQSLCDAAGVPQIQPYGWLVSAYTLVAGAGLIGAGLLVRARNYQQLSGVRVSQGLGQTGTQVAAGAAGGGSAWFAAGVVVGQAAYGFTSLRGCDIRERMRDWRGARVAAREWRRFAAWSSGAGVLQGAGLAIPAILVAAWYGPAAAGLYAVCQRAIGLPASVAGEAVGSAWYGTAAEIVRERRGDLRQPFVAVTRTLLIAGGAALLLVLIVVPPLFGTLFGDEWTGGGDLLVALAPMNFSLFAAVPAGQALQACERTDLLMLVAGLRLASPLLGIGVGHALGWSLTESLALYAVAMLAVSALNVAFAWRVTGRVT